MTFRFTAVAVALAACVVLACGAPDAAAPPTSSLGTTRRAYDESNSAPEMLVACTKRATFSDSGDFGPNGGTLWVGRNRLIIPPGALSEHVTIRGTIVGDTVAFLQFQPEGLHFKKPAGLILDATGCELPPDDAADVVYIDDRGDIAEEIRATYNNAWHTVAAPIEHFSGYAIAF
ncbi:MAG TPA: hypothetical protein VGP84_05660 [Gemmatimonadaceae bacterium]|nr:hypothetical protein [Gemmatimonadaceae bacterium]